MVYDKYKAAFDELKSIGAPVLHFGKGWGGNARFAISGEMNYDEIWADYYEPCFGEFGVNMKIIEILDRFDLWCEWCNPAVLDVYDN